MFVQIGAKKLDPSVNLAGSRHLKLYLFQGILGKEPRLQQDRLELEIAARRSKDKS